LRCTTVVPNGSRWGRLGDSCVSGWIMSDQTVQFPEADAAITRRSRLLITSVDTHVAGRLRRRRLVVGLSRREAAGKLGISCQQLTKYERAVARISAGNLYAIGSLLGVTVGYFFDGLGHDGTTEPSFLAGTSSPNGPPTITH
jgi:hypothetical protein